MSKKYRSGLLLLCLAPFQAASAAVFFDSLSDTSNLANSVNLDAPSNGASVDFAASSMDLSYASIEWSNGGEWFPYEAGEYLEFVVSAYQAGSGSYLTNVNFVAVYDDPGATEMSLGGDHLVALVANGDHGHYPIPAVPEATAWKLRMEFTVILSPTGGSAGTATFDSISVVPEPTSLLLSLLAAPLLLTRRRR